MGFMVTSKAKKMKKIINIILKVVIAYLSLSGVLLLISEVPEWMEVETISIGIKQYLISPFFILVKLFFIKTIESNSPLFNFLGICNILTACIIAKVRFKPSFMY